MCTSENQFKVIVVHPLIAKRNWMSITVVHMEENVLFLVSCIGNDELTGCRSKVVNTISKHKSTDGLNKIQFI